MEYEVFNLKQAAEHVHMDANELRHVAQRGEIAATERGGDWYFRHRDLDEWAQRDFLAAGYREQARRHEVIRSEDRRRRLGESRVIELFHPEAITLRLAGKSKPGVLRDMCDLAAATGLVYDVEGLFGELKAREEIASTAIGEGAAFLHPRFHDPYMFAESFIAYGRSERPVFFGASDGATTEHFFLICSTDHEEHLRLLARLAIMAHSTEFLLLLKEAEDPERVLAIIRAAEEGLLR